MKRREPMEDWAEQLHRELGELPDVKAPATLIPTVLRRIEAAEAARRAPRSWWEWPVPARVVSALLALATLAALVWAGAWLSDWGLGQRVLQPMADAGSTFSRWLDDLETVLESQAGFWRQHGRMILIGSASLLLATYLTCIAAGTALYRLAWRRNS